MAMLFRHPAIRRSLPFALSLLFNAGLCITAAWCLTACYRPGETEIAVELTGVATPKVAAALPPLPPRIRRLTEQAEAIIKTRATRKPPSSPVEDILDQMPPAPPVIIPHAVDPNPRDVPVPPPPQVSDMPPAFSAPPVMAALPGNGDLPTSPPGTGATGILAPAGTTGETGTTKNGNPDFTGAANVTPGGRGGDGIGSNGDNSGHGSGLPAPAPRDTPAPRTETAPTAPASPASTPAVPAAPRGPSRRSIVRSAPQPAYPADARDEGIQGTVRLRVKIDENGHIAGDPELVKSSGNRSLDRAAIRGVKKWDFEPELTDGTPVASTQLVDVKFKLD